ncbi:MAG TPA: hypothetical protein VEP90_00555 [Methylomirabilota bacterium]|nr:hypothetical protein [Methylomirabilota bacterium]
MIQVGEIVGYRRWRATKCGDLFSLWQYTLWQPHIPMMGDINVQTDSLPKRYQGVYAWNILEHLYRDRWAACYRFSTKNEVPLPSLFTSNGWIDKGDIFYIIIAGEIELWGDTMVHKRGYRASFGYPRGFYKDYKKGLMDRPNKIEEYLSVLEKVSKKYGVELI